MERIAKNPNEKHPGTRTRCRMLAALNPET
jgi:hypothetical protein